MIPGAAMPTSKACFASEMENPIQRMIPMAKKSAKPTYIPGSGSGVSCAVTYIVASLDKVGSIPPSPPIALILTISDGI